MRRGKTKRTSSAKRARTSLRIVSLPAPLGPTTSTTRPGPMGPGPSRGAELEHALAGTVDLANNRQVACHANAHQVGAKAAGNRPAIIEPGGARRVERYGADGSRQAEAVDA